MLNLNYRVAQQEGRSYHMSMHLCVASLAFIQAYLRAASSLKESERTLRKVLNDIEQETGQTVTLPLKFSRPRLEYVIAHTTSTLIAERYIEPLMFDQQSPTLDDFCPKQVMVTVDDYFVSVEHIEADKPKLDYLGDRYVPRTGIGSIPRMEIAFDDSLGLLTVSKGLRLLEAKQRHAREGDESVREGVISFELEFEELLNVVLFPLAAEPEKESEK